MDCDCAWRGDDLRHAARRRVLWIVLAINAAMFVVELGAGLLAGSVALQADSLDMLGDALVYGVSLAVVGGPGHRLARAAQLKGVVMLAFGLAVVAQVVFKVLKGVPPDPTIVSATGALALGANVVCLVLLSRRREDDINMHSTWVCSRNDIVANLGVMVSAAGVAVFGSIWPDVVVSLAIVALFLRSASGVLAAATAQLHAPRAPEAGLRCAAGCCPADACRCAAT